MICNGKNLRNTLVGIVSAFTLTMLVPTEASAGSVEGTISFSQRSSDGLIVVYVSGAITGRASCASTTTYWMVKDENSNVGKNQFATLLAAKMAGKTVRIVGTNTCSRWADGEDILEITII